MSKKFNEVNNEITLMSSNVLLLFFLLLIIYYYELIDRMNKRWSLRWNNRPEQKIERMYCCFSNTINKRFYHFIRLFSEEHSHWIDLWQRRKIYENIFNKNRFSLENFSLFSTLRHIYSYGICLNEELY
jgi:hypothetical protein